MQAYEEIYAAKDQILRNKRLLMQASIRREIRTISKLLDENARIKAEILRKYAVIIDY